MVMVMVMDARRGGEKRIRLVLRLHVGDLCLSWFSEGFGGWNLTVVAKRC